MAKQKLNIQSLNLADFKLAMQQNNPSIIDTRLPDYFELGHIPGAINYGFKQQYPTLANNLFNLANNTLLVCKPGEEAETIEHFQAIGFTHIIGYLSGGIEAWMQANEKYDMIISISAEELALDSKHNAKAVIIDVREADEYAAAHVANASNFPLSELIKNHPNIAKNTELLIYCDKGFRSMIAASVLKVMGFSNIKNVWGGFDQIVHQTVALKP
jgi:rhodanese-related sulfurtransferase